ncbi:P-loop containing nucleoside triphosphate hydrolase protein [Dipodascopsis tothii]|uniref:P-loop containing nucleoside triphosphate hydrolase protein n=1 Tax=Dipodascopsis tothii TaxID=44089 RepID=UPI0034CDAAF4
MSRQKYDFDDDDFYDENADYGEDEELSAEDQAQLDAAVAAVKQRTASLGVPDSVVRDVVWDSYYDVAKSVKILEDKYKKPAIKAVGKPAPAAKQATKPAKTPAKAASAQPQTAAAKGANVPDIVKGFSEPSPDDIVLSAQRGDNNPNASGKTVKRGPKEDEVARDLGKLSLASAPKRTLDVVSLATQTPPKPSVNFVVIGHVDAGKSTLMGRFLNDIGAVNSRAMQKNRKEAASIGKASFAFAWVLDQSEEERQRGVTIDVGSFTFETPKTTFTILDAPGHKDFVPNMIAGASEADYAVLVIDASTNAFESGFLQGGQTKEHTVLARSLGLQKLLVAVNKLDNVGWSQSRFAEIRELMSAYLPTIGFADDQVLYVPCSGIEGDNIVKRSDRPDLSWYTGGSLSEELEALRGVPRDLSAPLRMSVSDVMKASTSGVTVAGRLSAGTMQANESVMVVPSGELAVVKSIAVDDSDRKWAVAGENVVVQLAQIDAAHVRNGDIVCAPEAPVPRTRRLRAKVLVFELARPLLKGSTVLLHRGRTTEPAKLSKLVAVLGKGGVKKSKPRHLVSGQSAEIVLETEHAFPAELFTANRDLGRIVLRQDGATVATGVIEELLE